MSRVRCCLGSRLSRSAGFAFAAVLAALVAGGCAARKAEAPVAYAGASVAQAGYPSATSPDRGRPVPAPIPIEDDGIETQPPPRLHRPVKDDPTEPFSPNYGRFRALAPAQPDNGPVYIPNDLPQDFRLKLARAVETR